VDYKPKKGDLVYLPSNIMIIGEGLAQNTIYHKVHLQGDNWLVRTMDTLEVISSDKRNRSI
jgi:hypothetical protein